MTWTVEISVEMLVHVSVGFWMTCFWPRLEYHDLMSLFEFLDNGDGEITLLLVQPWPLLRFHVHVAQPDVFLRAPRAFIITQFHVEVVY